MTSKNPVPEADASGASTVGDQAVEASSLIPGAAGPESESRPVEVQEQPKQPVQTQEQRYVELWYNTYGNYGQFTEEVAVLRNGMVVRPSYFADLHGKKTVKYGDVEATVQVSHSRKHVYVKVFVPEDSILAIVRLEASSSNFYTKLLRGEGKVEKLVEDDVTPSKNGKKKYVKRFNVTRYINEERGMNIVLRKVLADELTVPIVTAKIVDDRLELYDAYDIKERLKKLGFKWDGEKKCWYGKPDTLELIRNYAEVVMA